MRHPDSDRVRSIPDLSNVEHALSALGSVWAVTSDLPDNFSPGSAGARVVRIDPATGGREAVAEGLDDQPVLAELAGHVWAKLDDRVVAFSADGTEVRSTPFEARGDMVAGDRFLWVSDFDSAEIGAIDPATGAFVETITTGRFPVAPIFAFGYVWIPSSIDGTVTAIEEASLGSAAPRTITVTDEQQTDVTAVVNGASGREVWVTDIEGFVFAISAEPAPYGEVRKLTFDRPINKVIPSGESVLLLPTWGRSILVADSRSSDTFGVIPIESIPFRAVADGASAWISTDGLDESLIHVDLELLEIVERFAIGANQSKTTGPTQPFLVGDEVWVPNRGDDAIFIVERS